MSEPVAVARLAADAPVPEGVLSGAGFVSVTRTPDELSIVAPASRVPPGARVEDGWTIFRIAGTLDFALTGILSRLAAPLAEAGVSLFAVSTFDTDYILVREDDAPRAADTWRAAGHDVRAA